MSQKNSVLEMIGLGIVLAIYAMAACTVLAIVNNFTYGRIAQNKLNKANAAMKAVVKDADSFEAVDSFPVASNSSITIQNIFIAVRAGYNFTTTPEYVSEGNSKTTLNDRTNAFSVGLGYSSNGSFFADIAARLTMLSDEYISPYADYLKDLASPMILNKRDLYSITATFGWRF